MQIMWDISTQTKPVARKQYHCEASDWIGNCCDLSEVSAEDLAVIQKAQAEGNKILPGDNYLKVTGKWEGEFTTFRARLDLDSICRKYNLYDDY